MPCRSCGTCEFWVDIEEPPPYPNDFGLCHRFPPTIVDKEVYRSCEPITHKDNWCGEWKTNN
jgi:hypothetical protein